MIVGAIRKRWPWVKHLLFGDGAYGRTALLNEAAFRGDRTSSRGHLVVEVLRRLDRKLGFTPLPRRWVVERPLGWLMR